MILESRASGRLRSEIHIKKLNHGEHGVHGVEYWRAAPLAGLVSRMKKSESLKV